jgi:hypothetical protein
MECWTCSEPAAAVCRFCGRASCHGHARTLPYVVSAWHGEKEQVHALVVEDAIWCGSCRPHPAPVRLDIVLQEREE